MCVIFIAEKKRPTESMIERAYETNAEGAGAAWRVEGPKGEPWVQWKKGMELGEIQDLAKEIPLPYVLHFRIASCGGPSRFLTHPFVVDENATTTIEGQGPNPVLFHNGHWGKYKDVALEAAVKNVGFKLPSGKWSDSRTMAWLAHHYGLGILEMIDEKVVVFTPKGQLELFGGPWSMSEEVWCSNKHWEFRGVSRNVGYVNNQGGRKDDDRPTVGATGDSTGTDKNGSRSPGASQESTKRTKGTGGSLPPGTTFRRGDEAVSGEEDRSEEVEGGEEGVSQRLGSLVRDANEVGAEGRQNPDPLGVLPAHYKSAAGGNSAAAQKHWTGDAAPATDPSIPEIPEMAERRTPPAGVVARSAQRWVAGRHRDLPLEQQLASGVMPDCESERERRRNDFVRGVHFQGRL
jgi:hypothetical protein